MEMSFAAHAAPVPFTLKLGALVIVQAEINGRPLFLFCDSGAASASGYLDLYENDGVLATKTNLDRFRRPWRPVFHLGLHSFAISWPRRAKPFVDWSAPRGLVRADVTAGGGTRPPAAGRIQGSSYPSTKPSPVPLSAPLTWTV